MTAPTIAPPPGRRPLPLEAQGKQVITRVVRRFTYPAEAPFISITLYYLLLFGVAALFYYFVPGASAAFTGARLADLMSQAAPTDATGAFAAPIGPPAGAGFSLAFALLLAVAMIGAVLLMVPASWVYMATRRKKGFDQSVVQTMLILALSVAGVIVIVRNSLALAFSLAGIVGAVRYRNNLPDTRDTLYVFLAIGVGLAAGVEALPAAAALSLVFNYAILAISRADYGMCELGRPSGHLLLTAPPTPAVEPAGNGKPAKKKALRDFNAVLVVRATSTEAARAPVERLLTAETRRWRLAEVETNTKAGVSHLKYLLRLGKRQERSDLEDALLEVAAPHVIGARIH